MCARRAFLLAASHVQRHHARMFFEEFPWPIFRSVDPREPADVRISLVADFKGKSSCCIPYGLARDLHKLEASELGSTAMQGVLLFAAWLVKVSVAAVETLHARSRRVADPHMNWETFCSNFISEEAKANRIGYKHALEPEVAVDDVIADLPRPPRPPHPPPMIAAPWITGGSVLQLFHKKYIVIQQAKVRPRYPWAPSRGGKIGCAGRLPHALVYPSAEGGLHALG